MPENILDLKDNFDLFIFDIYGVLWDGRQVIDGAPEILSALKKAGKKIIILSNGTLLHQALVKSNEKKGFFEGVHYDKIVSSGEVLHHFVMKDERRLRFYQFGRRSEDMFAGTNYQELERPEAADFVYTGIPQIWDGSVWRDCLDLKPFEDQLKYLIEIGKVLVCANPDLKAFENQYDEPVVRQGSVAEFYENNGGKVWYIGKPQPNVYEYALDGETATPERSLMIGDTLRTDIAGGIKMGMKTLLTLSGISYQDMKDAGLDDINTYVRQQGIVPDYIFPSI